MMKPTNWGCFLSHQNAAQRNMSGSTHILIDLGQFPKDGVGVTLSHQKLGHVMSLVKPCHACHVPMFTSFTTHLRCFFWLFFFDFHKNFKCVHHFPNTSDHSLSNDVHLQRHFHGFFQRFSYMFIWFMDIFHMFPLCSWSPLLSSTTHWAAFGKYQLLRHRETWHGLLENASFVIFSVYRLRLFDRLFW
jgi:hypothetical protein